MNPNKQCCGTCKFWDAADQNTQRAPCNYPVPKSVTKRSTTWLTGGCPTWVEKVRSEQA